VPLLRSSGHQHTKTTLPCTLQKCVSFQPPIGVNPVGRLLGPPIAWKAAHIADACQQCSYESRELSLFPCRKRRVPDVPERGRKHQMLTQVSPPSARIRAEGGKERIVVHRHIKMTRRTPFL
jgi:hypothetical protein